MQSVWLSLTLLFVCAVTMAAEPDAEDAELMADGADLYADFCANCHGDDVDGLQSFADTPADFVARLSGETDDMPDFTDFFDPEEIDALY
ncbi:MAG: cytochrome c, partial [Gammaproteobacteria bacterium]|nr:cytochrome c [Gammaproteobacteria bacterium]